MNEDIAKEIKIKEDEIEKQLDRIYTMVKEHTPQSFLKIEYKRAVERITEKYHLLLSNLEQQKQILGDEKYAKFDQTLREEYKKEIVFLAVAIYEATGVNTEKEER